MATHELKTVPEYFCPAYAGVKHFEIREAIDRYFEKGDIIILKEYNYISPTEGSYTGREIMGVVTFVTTYHQQKGYVVFEWKLIEKNNEKNT